MAARAAAAAVNRAADAALPPAGNGQQQITQPAAWAGVPAAEAKEANREAARLNELRDLAAQIGEADLVIQRKKDELTKARKDREGLVQQQQDLILSDQLPLVPDKLKPAKVPDAKQPVLFSENGQAATVDSVARTFATCAELGITAEQLQAGAWDFAQDGTPTLPAVFKLTGHGETLYAHGGEAEPGVIQLLPLLKQKEWKKLGATTFGGDEPGAGPLLGKKVYGPEGDTWHLGPIDGGVKVGLTKAQIRALMPSKRKTLPPDGEQQGEAPLIAREVGLTDQELAEAFNATAALQQHKSDKPPGVRTVQVAGKHLLAFDREDENTDGTAHTFLYKLVPEAEFDGATHPYRDVVQGKAEAHGAKLHVGKDADPYVIDASRTITVISTPEQAEQTARAKRQSKGGAKRRKAG